MTNTRTAAYQPIRWASMVGLMAVCAIPLLAAKIATGSDPFAFLVIDYSPAPGQFANTASFNDPTRALGPPSGGGTAVADNSSVVSLGGFGGSITLKFFQTVEDAPLNPMGLDAIVFGNAFYLGGDPDRHWAECAVIEISADLNHNGLADDPWFLIPGSHIANPADQFSVATWDDDVFDDTFPPALATWIPPGNFGLWTTSGFLLPPEIFAALPVVNPSTEAGVEGIFGYADYTPTLLLGDLNADNVVDATNDDPTITPADFYTVPDDPFAVGLTAGSGGGDAFDIAWAIDPDTGLPAELAGFDFIRITNGVDVLQGLFGEMSPEIDAVSDVASDPFGDLDVDGDIDLIDTAGLQRCFQKLILLNPECAVFDRDDDDVVSADDAAAFLERMTGTRN